MRSEPQKAEAARWLRGSCGRLAAPLQAEDGAGPGHGTRAEPMSQCGLHSQRQGSLQEASAGQRGASSNPPLRRPPWAAWEWMGGGGRRRAGQGTLLPPPRRGDRGLDPRSGHSGRWRGGGSGCLIRGSWHIRPFCHTPSLPKLPCTPGSHCKLLPCP